MLAIRGVHAANGNIQLQVDAGTTIASLKRQFATEYGGNQVYYQLLYKGKELNSGEATVEECGICNDDEIAVSDSIFSVAIQGPFPQFELTTMAVSRTTTIATIKEEIMRLYDYASPKEFDLLHNQSSLISSTVEKHKITNSDTLVVTERIVTQLEPLRKKVSVVTKPTYSPTVKKKESVTSYSAMMDAMLSLFSEGRSASQLRCSSMPDLIGGDTCTEDTDKVKETVSRNRKISMPVFGIGSNSSKFPVKPLK